MREALLPKLCCPEDIGDLSLATRRRDPDVPDAEKLPNLVLHLVGEVPEGVQRTRQQLTAPLLDNARLHRHQEPDNLVGLAAGICKVLDDHARAAALAEASLRRAHTLAYKRRAARVLYRPAVVSWLSRGWLCNAIAELWPRGPADHG